MNFEYSKRSLADLRHIAAYYSAADDPHAADAVAAAIQQAVGRVARH